MDATIRTYSTELPGEVPFIGDGESGELFTNSADGRAWVFDEGGFPTELGGACVNKPMANNLFTSNYVVVDVTNPDTLPISLPNPLLTPPGYARELNLLLVYNQEPITPFTPYFDYEVDWGSEVFWNPLDVPLVDTPLDLYEGLGVRTQITLSCFGPQTKWNGKVVWTSGG